MQREHKQNRNMVIIIALSLLCSKFGTSDFNQDLSAPLFTFWFVCVCRVFY